MKKVQHTYALLSSYSRGSSDTEAAADLAVDQLGKYRGKRGYDLPCAYRGEKRSSDSSCIINGSVAER